jgi:hypothetical protein
LFAVTTGFPLFSAASISDLAGSIPPITSTTMSTSGRVRGEQGPVDRLVPAVPDPPHRDPRELQPGADPQGQVIGLLGEQPGHLRPDDPAAEHGYLQRAKGLVHEDCGDQTPALRLVRKRRITSPRMSVRSGIFKLSVRTTRAPVLSGTKPRQGMPWLRGEASGAPGPRTANRQRDRRSRLESPPFKAAEDVNPRPG